MSRIIASFRFTVLAVAVLVTAPIASPGVAHAGTVSVSGSTVNYVAAPGEVNNPTIGISSGTVTVHEPSPTVQPGGGCSTVSAFSVSCPSAGLTAANIDLGDQNDTAVLSGLTLPTRVTGGPGNDTLVGTNQADVLLGGLGSDSFTGGGGIDTVSYEDHATGVIASLEGGSSGSPGEGDSIQLSVENLEGSLGNDTLTGNGAENQLSGAGGNDVLVGGTDIQLDGSDGAADVFDGGAGTDLVDYRLRSCWLTITPGPAADDGCVAFSSAPAEGDTVKANIEGAIGGSGNDRMEDISGVASDNLFIGGPGSDTLIGAAGNDTLLDSFPAITDGGGQNLLEGGDGDDSLAGWTGKDIYKGGDGEDQVSYFTHSAAVSVDIGGGGDGVPGENDAVSEDVENVTGGSGNDFILGNGNDNVLTGGSGSDTLIGSGGSDTLNGGNDADLLDGGSGTDAVNGDSGIDFLNGGTGGDTLAGGDGDDTLAGYLGNDSIAGGAGSDAASYAERIEDVTVTLGVGASGEAGEADTIGGDVEGAIGGSGNDVLRGNDGAGTFNGGAGDDSVDGGAGADSIDGGSGFDLIDYSSRSLPVAASFDGNANDGQAGEGDNLLESVEAARTGAASDTQLGSAQANDLTGNGGNDSLSGLAGLDLLNGGDGDDALDGGADDDRLRGGPGSDRLSGGSGADALGGGSDNDLLDGGAGADLIGGGGGADTADYSARNADLAISLDGQANDGAAGEADNVQLDVENVVGGSGADSITGSAAPNRIDGGPGQDDISAGAGDDFVSARDGVRDVISCGAGRDTVSADSIDQIDTDCETRSATSPMVIATTKAGLSRSGKLKIRLRCTMKSTCAGNLSLRSKLGKRSVVVGKKSFRVAANRSSTLSVKLSRKARRQALRKGRLSVRATASMRGDAGTSASATRTITVKPKARSRR